MSGHLIHIGYPKTGSNFLRRWFAGHPQLAYRDGGIAGFSNIYELAREAAARGQGALYYVTSAEGLSTPHLNIGIEPVDYDRIERHPMPPAQTLVCETLAALFPNAHILIVTRGFRSMVLSTYSQYVRTGGEVPFEEHCRRKHEGAVYEQDAWGYSRLIGLYRDAFPGRVINLPYELLRDDPRRFLALIEERLGLDHHQHLPKRQNPSLSPIELAWYPRLTRMVRALPFGRRVEHRYLQWAFANRLARPIALLQRLRPVEPVPMEVPGWVIQGWQGQAELLRNDPVYSSYAADYLL